LIDYKLIIVLSIPLKVKKKSLYIKMDFDKLSNSPDDLAYSVFLDRIRQQPVGETNHPIDHVRQASNPSWIPDDAVTACKLCKKDFTIFRRRHHCRLCSSIFCFACSSHFINLPKNLEIIPECPTDYKSKWGIKSLWSGFWKSKVYSAQKERVCDTCYARYEEMKKFEVYILIFGYLDIKSLLTVSLVCKQWSRAVNVTKSIFRDIQYTLPSFAISDLQKRIFWQSRPYLGGHSRWLIKLLTYTDWSSQEEVSQAEQILQSPRVCKCWSLMCTRKCQSELTGYDCIELVNIKITSSIVSAHIKNALNKLSNAEFNCFLPQIIYALKWNFWLLELLIEKSTDIMIRTMIYWNLSLLKTRDPTFHPFYNTYLSRLHDTLGKKIVFGELIQGRRFLKLLSKTPPNPIKSKEYLQQNKEHLSCGIRWSPSEPISSPTNQIFLPLNPTLTVRSINAYGIQTKESLTSPLLIPLVCQTEFHPKIAYSILYKKECLIQDYIIVNIIRLMDIILKRDEGIDFGILTYQVLPLDSKSGYIEIILNAETLYAIKNQMNFTLQNYLLEHNPKLSISEIRDRFVKSTAAYCVISFLLGVGDRHLDNIMISKDGYLFHIDYGYILGFDPKPLTPAIRITQDMVDVLGGESSKDYQTFKSYCTQIYNCLRKYTSLFMSMLLLITDDGLNLDPNRYSKDRLKEEILSRFVPSESTQDAGTQLLIKIDKSYRAYTPHLFDFWHYHSKETFSKIFMK